MSAKGYLRRYMFLSFSHIYIFILGTGFALIGIGICLSGVKPFILCLILGLTTMVAGGLLLYTLLGDFLCCGKCLKYLDEKGMILKASKQLRAADKNYRGGNFVQTKDFFFCRPGGAIIYYGDVVKAEITVRTKKIRDEEGKLVITERKSLIATTSYCQMPVFWGDDEIAHKKAEYLLRYIQKYQEQADTVP